MKIKFLIIVLVILFGSNYILSQCGLFCDCQVTCMCPLGEKTYTTQVSNCEDCQEKAREICESEKCFWATSANCIHNQQEEGNSKEKLSNLKERITEKYKHINLIKN